MKNKINKNILLSVLLIAFKGYCPPGIKGTSVKATAAHHVSSGITVLPATIQAPQLQSGVTNTMISAPLQQVAVTQQPQTVLPIGTTSVANVSVLPQVSQTQLQAGVAKLFDEEKYYNERIKQDKAYSALQYVALELINVLENLTSAANKENLQRLMQANVANPNTLLQKAVVVKFPTISNAGGLGYYLTQSNLKPATGMTTIPSYSPTTASIVPTTVIPTINVSIGVEEKSRLEAFIRKWDANAQGSYTNTSPTDQAFIQEFKNSYNYLKDLTKKYLNVDLNKTILAYPDRINNEISVLIDFIVNQLIPKINIVLGTQVTTKVPYVSIKPKANAWGYNARYIFALLCQCVYSNGQQMDPNSANPRSWATKGIPS